MFYFIFATSHIFEIFCISFYLNNKKMILSLFWYGLMLLLPPFAVIFLILNVKKLLSASSQNKQKWAFFHPFCNDGGGGEKVLWCIIKELTQKTEDEIAIYSLEADKDAILERVKSRFGISIEKDRFLLIFVPGRKLLTSKGFLTMIMHLLLPMVYAFKCLWQYQPTIFYDTTGYASTLVLVKLFLPWTTTAAYVHYPFISEDMIQKVREQRADFNNSQAISRSPLLSKGKLYYYIFVLKIYKLIGRAVDFAQTNSSWTHNHMQSLWPRLSQKGKLVKLYPPCTVKPLLSIKKPSVNEEICMVSLAQFRPEKQQHLQLQVLAQLLKMNLKRKVSLKICGTTRGADDEAILANLKTLAKNLQIQNNVEFVVNQPYSKIIQCFTKSHIGIHTMEAEHFGISVVEMLAAGLIVIAHNSAGPKMDIIKDPAFLAQTKEKYIEKIANLINLPENELTKYSSINREKSECFSEEEFQRQFLNTVQAHAKQD